MTGSCGATAYDLATGTVANWDITRLRYLQLIPDLKEHRSPGVLIPVCINDTHANMHMQTCDQTQRYTKRENRPFRSVRHGWDVGKLLFASFHFKADPLLFCLWMLSSCSSSPVPLPPLLQCSWDLLVHLFSSLLSSNQHGTGGATSPLQWTITQHRLCICTYTHSHSPVGISASNMNFLFFFSLSSPASVLGFASQGRLTD